VILHAMPPSVPMSSLAEHSLGFRPQRLEVRTADRHDAVGLFEEPPGEPDHVTSLRVPQIPRIQIAEPHAIEAVGVPFRTAVARVPLPPRRAPTRHERNIPPTA